MHLRTHVHTNIHTNEMHLCSMRTHDHSGHTYTTYLRTCMPKFRKKKTYVLAHWQLHTLAQNCHCEFCCGMHLTCKNTSIVPDRNGSVKGPEASCLHKRDFVEGAAFTKVMLWRELPSQKVFCEESCLHARDSVKRSCLHERDFVKGAAFMKGILWKELPSQKGFCEESCLNRRILWR